MSEKMKRRLTTILCADVEGYARLMEANETRTLATLRRCRDAMAALVERHEGRIVNTWGDAVIAEFTSVVEAVQCAVEIQQELSGHDPDLPASERMQFQIGINLGDVIVEGSDIYGEGVNIAARLQELAGPGGILVSGPVYEQVHNKLTIGFDYLGRQQVKNVASPVSGYRVIANGVAGERQSPAPDAPDMPGSNAEVRRALASDVPALTERRSPAAFHDRVLDWLADLPRPIASIIVVSVFLFLVNLFTGFKTVWFHWPVSAMFLIVVLWSVLRRRPSRGRRSRRE